MALSLGLRAALAPGADGKRAPEGVAVPGWGLAALGPYLLLELALLANPGRIAVLTGWDLPTTTGFIFLGFAVACAALAWSPSPLIRGVAGVLAVVVLTRPTWLSGNGVWLLLAAQVFLTVAMASALAPVPGGRVGRVYGWTVAAAMLFFVLTFLYYRRYGWPELWSVLAALAAVPAILTCLPVAVAGAWRAAAAVLVVAVAGIALGYVGPRHAGRIRGPRRTDDPRLQHP